MGWDGTPLSSFILKIKTNLSQRDTWHGCEETKPKRHNGFVKKSETWGQKNHSQRLLFLKQNNKKFSLNFFNLFCTLTSCALIKCISPSIASPLLSHYFNVSEKQNALTWSYYLVEQQHGGEADRQRRLHPRLTLLPRSSLMDLS